MCSLQMEKVKWHDLEPKTRNLTKIVCIIIIFIIIVKNDYIGYKASVCIQLLLM